MSPAYGLKTKIMEMTPAMLIKAYVLGVFPMADARHAEDITWHDPAVRGLFLFDRFRVPKRLRKKINHQPYRVTFNKCFDRVIRACADVRSETWINDKIVEVYTQLHSAGFVHSVEAWEGDTLVGGVYGVSIGQAFFGESMFSTKTDASKIALVYLMSRLWMQGYHFCDAQFFNPHLSQFGLVEMPRDDYKKLLGTAVVSKGSFKKDYSLVSDGVSVTGSVSFSTAGVSSVDESGKASPVDSLVVGGDPSGCFSDENSCDFADVLSFLQSITHTS